MRRASFRAFNSFFWADLLLNIRYLYEYHIVVCYVGGLLNNIFPNNCDVFFIVLCKTGTNKRKSAGISLQARFAMGRRIKWRGAERCWWMADMAPDGVAP